MRLARRSPNEGRVTLVGRKIATSANDVGPIADTRLRDHDARRRRITLDLPPQIRDVHAEVLLRASELAAPDGVEDLLVGERSAARAHQRVQDLPLDGGQMNLSTIAIDAPRHRIDRETMNRPRRWRGRRGGARTTQLRVNASRELE